MICLHCGGGLLSKRQAQILRLVQTGLLNKEIGYELGISTVTVRNHLTTVYLKLGVSNRTQAVAEGVKRGLLS